MTRVSCSKRKKQNLMNLAWARKRANRSINNDNENQDPRKKDFSRGNFLDVVVNTFKASAASGVVTPPRSTPDQLSPRTAVKPRAPLTAVDQNNADHSGDPYTTPESSKGKLPEAEKVRPANECNFTKISVKYENYW